MRQIFGQVVGPLETCGRTVVIDDEGRIAEVKKGRSTISGSGDIDAEGCLVVPGFIDLHVHGGGGADFMDGDASSVSRAAQTHAHYGTTGLLATTLTASPEATARAISAIRDKVRVGRNRDEARILGIHLEGPYLCAARCGAQPPQYIRPPDTVEFQSWLELGQGIIRKITLAPEIEGADELIRMAIHEKVIVSIGHTDALASEIDAAVLLGASQATHLFNGMRGLTHREPGAAGGLLANRGIVAEVIADGIHLDPRIVKLIIAAKGLDGVILITDAMSGAGMADGAFLLGGAQVTVKSGAARLTDGTLAGSVLTMDRAFANVQQFAGIDPVAAVKLSSWNSARDLGLSALYGAIEPGRPADIAIVNQNTGEVQATLIDGQDAYRR